CPGKAEEYGNIVDNRDERLIVSAEASIQTVEFNAEQTFAWIFAPCRFRDIRRSDGLPFVATGNCELTAVYENGRWWLCDSHFRNATLEPAGRVPGTAAGPMRYWP